jgi:hypothetical protein
MALPFTSREVIEREVVAIVISDRLVEGGHLVDEHILRNHEFCSTLDRYRTATNATAAVSIEAIHGICSLLSMANACSHAVPGLASTSARGNSLRSATPGGGVARYGGKMT